MTAHPEAVAAAAEAAREQGWMCDPYVHEDGPQEAGRCHACDALLREFGEAAVAAARPYIAAEVRADVADAIRAEADRCDRAAAVMSFEVGLPVRTRAIVMRDAARIAEGRVNGSIDREGKVRR